MCDHVLMMSKVKILHHSKFEAENGHEKQRFTQTGPLQPASRILSPRLPMRAAVSHAFAHAQALAVLTLLGAREDLE